MITSVDHWIAFILLGLIGGNMIKEASSGCEECERMDSSFGWRAMLPMAIATSIAVSYTHLDVYKRQAQMSMGCTPQRTITQCFMLFPPFG